MHLVFVFLGFFALGAVLLVCVLFLAQQGQRLRRLERAVQELQGPRVPVPEVRSSLPPVPPAVPRRAIDWEAFLGVKLFAWIGGFVLFLGVVFLVKYSFENNLITPALRVFLGLLIGLALVTAGWLTARRRYRIPGQSLCATGLLVLYAAIFGAHTFYGLISLGSAFLGMSLVTVGAFLLAVKLDAAVVVTLGLLGGFLTPPLLSNTRQSWAIFGYIALLDSGIAAVVLRKRWDYLLALAALGTVALELAWLPTDDASRLALGFPIFLGLQALFLAVVLLRQRLEPVEHWSVPSAAAVGCGSLVLVLAALELPTLAANFALIFGSTLIADTGLLALAFWRPKTAQPAFTARHLAAALALGLTCAIEWQWHQLALPNVPPALELGWYLAFFLLFYGFPFFLNGRSTWPWVTSAWAGVLHFSLVYEVVRVHFPAWRNGFLPAAFILPYAFAVWWLARRRAPGGSDARLVWQGAAAIYFLSLVFPIQFEREWITLGWGVEGFALLLLGMKKRIRPLRYAGVILLALTLLKLFLYDLANLSQLYRIGAFIGVAVILLVASFVYQRFLAPDKNTESV